MKRFLAAFLTAVMIVMMMPLGVTALEYTEGYYTYTVTYGKATITDIDKAISGDVVIPDTLGRYFVSEIGDRAFEYCTNLTSVTIPDSVTSIGEYAFYYCDSLTSVTISDCVTSIGDHAFQFCISLTSVVIGNSVTSIGNSAFYGCTHLMSVTIPDSVRSIGWNAFYNCTRLTSVVIGNSVTSIGNSAFYFCDSLTSVVIGNSVTSIGNSAFEHCTNLTSVTIPDSITSIGNNAFVSCKSLTSIDVSEYNTAYISMDGVLFTKDETTLIQYPIGRTDTNYTIPDSVTNIGDSAFYNCDSLTSITIPNSVTSIGDHAFQFCTNLTIRCYAYSYAEHYAITNGIPYKLIAKPDLSNDFSIDKNGILIEYDGDGGNVVIPDNVTSIGDRAFLYCYSLTGITIPDSVTSIGNNAFEYCTNLTSVTIPDSVTSIGENAFFECTDLTINCYYYSAAHKYAVNNSISHKLIYTPTPGDVTGDGSINLSDVTLILKHIAKWNVTVDADIADVTGNGYVNISDVTLILKYIAKWNVTLR